MDQPVLCSLIKHAISANQSMCYMETLLSQIFVNDKTQYYYYVNYLTGAWISTFYLHMSQG